MVCDTAMIFPVVMYGCESWTLKKAECQRIDAFELWCWRRLLRVPWTARRSNQSIIKEINPEYSLEELMLKLKLKLQYFSHLMQRANSLEKALMLGKMEGRRRRGRQSIHPFKFAPAPCSYPCRVCVLFYFRPLQKQALSETPWPSISQPTGSSLEITSGKWFLLLLTKTGWVLGRTLCFPPSQDMFEKQHQFC